MKNSGTVITTRVKAPALPNPAPQQTYGMMDSRSWPQMDPEGELMDDFSLLTEAIGPVSGKRYLIRQPDAET